ncbi:N-acetylmuramoyl-L-alanine amidase CwlD [Bacillaceae bacterium SIJ1]|uniref:N-acetylmuramoyl-L-alanine amidase CwlD n=1 Tax=Litoribacterium kuwaitense TaxID=1398745 RepID=UPI0013EA43F5|nr:N-acetylmuramoyl-L-alanine amidase CwlD [Litoribacterium kuwaitense]NGP46658.1 N-acetylmuramoyl-L-alanine amidase CwlD [Litoribacterium kuwaitense]
MKVKWTVGIFSCVLVFSIALFVFNGQGTPTVASLPLSGKVIMLDAGHGGADGGAVNRDGTILEKDVTLSLTKKLRDYLQEGGALVYLTREKDTDLAGDIKGLSKRKTADLKKRLSLINRSEADLFLSIHLNAIPSSRWRGAQTFYFPRDDNERLAESIQSEVRDQLGNTERVALGINTIFLQKHAEMPSALFEAGFLSNTEEARLLASDDYQDKMAAAIYRGILRYFDEADKESVTSIPS